MSNTLEGSEEHHSRLLGSDEEGISSRYFGSFMKENFKTAGIIVVSVVGIIVGIGFALYSFVGFLNWLFSDPFDWIEEQTPNIYQEPTDFQLCRNSGGIPVKSSWNGELKRCDTLKN